ncbi:hypothetical protein POSPLADRAFT_1052361 [Postia placenta MAD-698-R-SB12]|uniref:Uncharacterized protein n=1 Tax=Postia placenta MAD-698-R-SB12 TaxID=670580 RepID=A0A1X6NAL3_9APHY|nr:hypothetical protein POSPLADRAFT_1052361 [Postia placenta MAD-698-R-SB12]OSX65689.1 hypothetical protein POSPLADRAFT_1052361 [Postia placenta MAD-698-R-SB12]
MSENHHGRERLTRGTHRYRPYVPRGPPELDNRQLRNYLLIAAWMVMCFLSSRLPPTLSPSSPLPTVSEPSPISDHDTLLFITAARSRRASKLSLTSSSGYSQCNSTATLASNASSAVPSLSSSTGATPANSFLRSLRSFLSNGSLLARAKSQTTRSRPSTCSASPLHEDEIDVPVSAPPVPRSHPSHASDLYASARKPTLPPLPPDSRALDEPATFPQSDSPDIKTILATTPRPHRKSSMSCLSGRSRLPSRSRSQPRRAPFRRHVSEGIPSARRREGELRRTSEASLPVPALGGRPASPTELAYARNAWVEDSFVSDYGVLLDGTGTTMDVVGGKEACLERELDGSGNDMDSSIDIHMPLPNLMLRHGLLSPNSKLLPQASRVGTPSEDEDAPSPLTHKLSANTLKTKITPSAFHSPHPLSRIGSATGLSALAKDGRPRGLSHSPCPQDRRVSSSSATSSTVGVPSRTFVSSLRPTSSTGRLVARILGYIHELEETLDSTSSASSARVFMPVTPVGYDGPGRSPIFGSQNGRMMQRPKLDAWLAFMGWSVSGGSNLAATPSSLPSARTPSVL